MSKLHIVHLLEDVSFGGVVKALSIFSSPELERLATHENRVVSPGSSMAPRIDADIIITHFTPRWRTLPFLASLKARNRHAYLVHIEHSYTRAFETNHVASRARFRTMLRASYAFFDEIVAVSYGQADWLREAGAARSATFSVIEPWSGHDELRLVPPVRYDGKDVLTIGAYGRFDEIKGFDLLIEAMRLLDPARYRLLLGGWGEQEADLRSRAAGLRHVEFVGKVTDLSAYLARCHVVVVPSRREAFGQVAMEAKLAGRPIVTSPVDGLPEQVGDAGLVINCAKTPLLAAILSVLSPATIDRMAMAARASVADAERHRVAKWLALFDRAACAI